MEGFKKLLSWLIYCTTYLQNMELNLTGRVGARRDRGWWRMMIPGETPNKSQNNRKTRQGTKTKQNSMREASDWWVYCGCPEIKILLLEIYCMEIMKPKIKKSIQTNSLSCMHMYIPAVTLTYVMCPLLVKFWGQDIWQWYAPASDWLMLWMWSNRCVLLDDKL